MDTHGLHPRRMLLLACGVFLAAGMVLSGLGPALPFLAARSQQHVVALGVLFTAISLGVILAQALVGRASDRFGLQIVLAAGMVLMSVGALALAVSSRFVLLVLAALLMGIGYGAVLSAGNLLVARLYPTRSAAALNGVNVFYGIGSIIGPLLAGYAGAQLGASYAALALGAAVLLVLAPFLMGRLEVAVHDTVAVPPADDMRGAGVLWLLAVLLLIYIGTEVGLGGWITVYLITSAHLTPEMAALGASGFWLGFTAGRMLGTALGLRLTSSALLLSSLSGVLGAAAILLFGVGAQLPSVVGILLLGLACGPVFPTLLAVIMSATQGSNRAAARVLALGNTGGLLLPALFGFLLGSYGPAAMAGMVFGAALGMLIVGAIGVALLVQRRTTLALEQSETVAR